MVRIFVTWQNLNRAVAVLHYTETTLQGGGSAGGEPALSGKIDRFPPILIPHWHNYV